jgi:hypothetical protein
MSACKDIKTSAERWSSVQSAEALIKIIKWKEKEINKNDYRWGPISLLAGAFSPLSFFD